MGTVNNDMLSSSLFSVVRYYYSKETETFLQLSVQLFL